MLTDRTVTIRASVADVQFELMLTVALVVMVIFLFLRNLAATVIPSVAVPLSLVGTFGVMYLLGYSLDNLSLMALTISTGFVVDDAAKHAAGQGEAGGVRPDESLLEVPRPEDRQDAGRRSLPEPADGREAPPWRSSAARRTRAVRHLRSENATRPSCLASATYSRIFSCADRSMTRAHEEGRILAGPIRTDRAKSRRRSRKRS